MTLLQRTNQLWKLYLFITLMALGAGITLLQSLLTRVLEKEAIAYLVTGAMLVMAGVFAWAFAAITCPACKFKLFRHAITQEGLGRWFTWLTNLEKCPQCEARKVAGGSQRRRGKAKGQKSQPL